MLVSVLVSVRARVTQHVFAGVWTYRLVWLSLGVTHR